MSSDKTVIITGCAGFLGSHLCRSQLTEKFNVIGIDNLLTGQIKNVNELKQQFPSTFHFLEKDVCDDWTDIESDLKSVSKIETIYHFASPASVPHYQKYSLETMSVNSIGLKNCLTFANKKNAKVIFASTSEIYGDPQISPQNENYWGHVNPFGPRSCYDESKRYGEALIYSWNERFKTQHGIIRIFNTYGPHMNSDDGRVILRLLQQALGHKPLTIYGDGLQTRSFCYVDDLIDGIIKYAYSAETRPMNLGRSDQITIQKLAELIIQLTQSKSKIQHTGLPVDDPRHRWPDLNFARTALNYNATTNLTTGLTKMISWLTQKDLNDQK